MNEVTKGDAENAANLRHLTEENDRWSELSEETSRLRDIAQAMDPGDPRYNKALQDWQDSKDALDAKAAEIRAAEGAPISPPRYARYTLPGGDNYRELLLTLPAGGPTRTWDKARDDLVAKWAGNRGAQTYASLPHDRKMVFDDMFGDETAFMRRERHDMPEGVYRSGHWDEPNIVAHIRFDDRMVDGKRALHIAEVQSDWHQAGRKTGYAISQPQFWVRNTISGNSSEFFKTMEEADAYRDALPPSIRTQTVISQRVKKTSGVPDAPFKTTWPELSIKRMIRHAAENGYDLLTWDTGATNAERYDLSKQISKIVLHDNTSGGMGAPRMEGPFTSGQLEAFDHHGKRVISQHAYGEQGLVDLIGKEAAERILAAEVKHARSAGIGVRERRLEGLDLKVGGEGMTGFYDKILPATVSKLTKKFGGKVETVDLPVTRLSNKIGEEAPVDKAHALTITPALRDAAVNEGFPLFQAASKDAEEPRGRITMRDNNAVIDLFSKRNESTFMHEAGHKFLEEMAEDAADPSAPGQIKNDFQTVLDWLGAEDAESIDEKMHEKFARGFEQYLREGKAPSSALQRAFDAFKAWLKSIYRSLIGLGKEIPDSIRGVMDRMIATDEEIAAQRGAAEPVAQNATTEPGSVGRPREGRVGDKLASGEIVRTATGRETTPFPKVDMTSERKTSATVKRVDQWLMENALAEAQARGDEFNARQFEAAKTKPQQVDKDSAEFYLFDKDSVQPVPAPFLKPIAAVQLEKAIRGEIEDTKTELAASDTPIDNAIHDIITQHIEPLIDEAFPKAPEATEAGPEGTRQTLMPGVNPVTGADRARLGANAPLRGGNAEMPAGGLFDEVAKAQQDLYDMTPTEDGMMSRKDLETKPPMETVLSKFVSECDAF